MSEKDFWEQGEEDNDNGLEGEDTEYYGEELGSEDEEEEPIFFGEPGPKVIHTPTPTISDEGVSVASTAPQMAAGSVASTGPAVASVGPALGVQEQSGGTMGVDLPAADVGLLSNPEIIFSSLFSLDHGVMERKQEFLTSMSGIDLFRDEYVVFYTLIKVHTKLSVSEKFLRLYMATNRATFSKHKHIDYSHYEGPDVEDTYAAFVASCVDLFAECAKRTIAPMDFYRAIEMHRMEYINSQALMVLERGATILTDGVTDRNRVIAGYEDMRAEVNKGLVTLDNLAIKDGRRGIITHDMLEDDEDDESAKLQLLGKLGIDEVDAHLGGIFEGDLVSLLAPSKGGKSRLSTQALHRTMVELGTNIAMWSVENGPHGFKALMRACHFDYYYNRDSDGNNRKIINADMIRRGTVPAEVKDFERASWADFRHNNSYGRMTIIDQEFQIDSFLDHIRRAVEVGGAKFICVDYLQMIGSGKTNMPKQERIAQAYQEMLQYLKANRIAGIFPAQLKQSAVGSMANYSPEELLNAELRDSAGESYEVIKTPDVNLVLFGTPETMSQGEMKLLSIPSRNVSTFEPVDLYVDLGTCTFQSIKSA